MKRPSIILAILSISIFSGCQSKPAATLTPSPTRMPIAVMTKTVQPTSTRPMSSHTPTTLSTPTIGSTATPVFPLSAANTPQPFSVAINRWNLPNGKELGILGRGKIIDVDWSPDSGVIAVLTAYGIDFYNAETMERFSTYGIKNADQIKYNPRGKTIAIAKSQTILIVSLLDGTVQKTLDISPGLAEFFSDPGGPSYMESAYVMDMSFSPDGKRLGAILAIVMTGATPTNLMEWDIETGNRLIWDVNSPWYLSYSPDGSRLATRERKDGKDGITLFSTNNGELAGRIDVDSPSFAFLDSRDEMILCNEGSLERWNVITNKSVEDMGIQSCDWFVLSVDQKTIAVLRKASIELWDLSTKNRISTIPRISEDSSTTLFDVSGRKILTEGPDMIIRIWNVADASLINVIPYTNSVSQITFPYPAQDNTSVNQLVASTDEFGNILSWDYPAGISRLIVSGGDSSLQQMILAPDGMNLVVVDSDNRIRFIDIKTGQMSFLPTSPGAAISFSPDGKYLAIQGRGKVQLIDITTWTVLGTWDAAYGARSLFRPDGLLVQVGPSKDSTTVEVRDLINQRIVTSLPNTSTHGAGLIWPFAVMNNRFIVIPMDDYSIQLYDLNNLAHPRLLSGHGFLPGVMGDGGDMVIDTLVIHPFEDILATSGFDGIVFFWNMQNGTRISTWNPNCGIINTLAFSQDGRYLGAGCANGTIHLWGIQ